MSIETVRTFLAGQGPDLVPTELEQRSETHSLAAAWGILPAQIAKTLALRIGQHSALLVSCGDSRLDNQKVRDQLGGKARMLPPEEASSLTGHPVGGICPFGLSIPLPIYCDVLLQRFETVVTAAGDPRFALRIHPRRLAEITAAQWVDVCVS